MLEQLWDGIGNNLFKPMLMFFYAGFMIPILRVEFEFPKAVYQALTMFLLIAIGWHGGEELAALTPDMIAEASGFMALGFVSNLIIGALAFVALRRCTSLRQIDAATVAGYYGSDSAGTFVTCVGVLAAAGVAFAPYMPVMLAVMEIPGCLLALVLVARMRRRGMDQLGNMPGEPAYIAAKAAEADPEMALPLDPQDVEWLRNEDLLKSKLDSEDREWLEEELQLAGVGAEAEESWQTTGGGGRTRDGSGSRTGHGHRGGGSSYDADLPEDGELSFDDEALEMAAESDEPHAPLTQTSPANASQPTVAQPATPKPAAPLISTKLLHEVFLNPGIYLLFAGIAIGFVSRVQGKGITGKYDLLFNELFQPLLCLFLLEMGMTAARRLPDLRAAGGKFVAFGLIAPNVFACIGIAVAHAYSMALGKPFDIGTYTLFAVLCGAASYIAVPAVQRIAIPEASPTLPLAASLGLTFTYNVTIGIPLYMIAAQALTAWLPVT